MTTQVRSVATVGGGIMNFSTYSDMIPVWVATGAEVRFKKLQQQPQQQGAIRQEPTVESSSFVLADLFGDGHAFDHWDPRCA